MSDYRDGWNTVWPKKGTKSKHRTGVPSSVIVLKKDGSTMGASREAIDMDTKEHEFLSVYDGWASIRQYDEKKLHGSTEHEQ